MRLKHTAYMLVCCSFLVVSCGNEAEKTAANNTATQKTQCYSKNDHGDVTVVQLSQEQNKISGYSAWVPKEKDSARGMLTGTITDNLINAQYTYLIEGTVQTEEVIYKLEGDTLIQGRGELDEKMGVLTIKDPTKVKWTDPLAKTDCKTVQGVLDDTIEAVKEINKAK